jgi:hypothetical protein
MGLCAGHATQRHLMIPILAHHSRFDHAIYPLSAADAARVSMAKITAGQRAPDSHQPDHRVSRAQSDTSDDLVSIVDGAPVRTRRNRGA